MISVIIPIYNVEPYIEKCLLSVLNQTYTEGLEVIIVDDCGTDNSMEIAERVIAQNKRTDITFRVIHHENNKGLSSSRNSAMDIATGEYIYFLDSDDFLEFQTIEILVNEILDFDVVSFGHIKEELNGNEICRTNFQEVRINFSDAKSRFDFINTKVIKYAYGWEVWSRLYRRDLIEKNNLRFPDNKKVFAEDIYFTICYLFCARNYKCIPVHLYHYIQHPNSIMGQCRGKNNMSRFVQLNISILQFARTIFNNNEVNTNFPLLHYNIMLEGAINNNHKIEKYAGCKLTKEEFSFFTYWLQKAYYNKHLFMTMRTYNYLIANYNISIWLDRYKLEKCLNRVLIKFYMIIKRGYSVLCR